MNWFADYYRRAVGQKAVMAWTGIVLFLYVLAHMLGNLKIYQGREALNHYAEWLRETGSPAIPHGGMLWGVRIVLLVAVVLHIVAAVQLTLQNRRARPQRYLRWQPQRSTYASRTMRFSGVLIALFVVYHLLHFTWGTAHTDFRPGDVYHNVVAGFQIWWVSAIYIVAQLALGMHLFHGLWSMFQSLGWNHPRFNRWRKVFAISLAVLITLGNISVPAAVLAGVIS